MACRETFFTSFETYDALAEARRGREEATAAIAWLARRVVAEMMSGAPAGSGPSFFKNSVESQPRTAARSFDLGGQNYPM